ncbi:unnamed protein product, partial [Symbiodinium pilosum]
LGAVQMQLRMKLEEQALREQYPNLMQARGTETPMAKNVAMKETGIIVPKLPETINLYTMVEHCGVEEPEEETAEVPVDSWAAKLVRVRKPVNFITITDDREELKHCNFSISDVFSRIGVSGVLSLPWFRRLLPAGKFIVTADHGAPVSGAYNTVVTSRGQRIKLLANPDQRVVIQEFAKKSFKDNRILDFVVAVMQTARKPANLILNADGCITATWCDIFPNFPPDVNKEKVVDSFALLGKEIAGDVPLQVINDAEGGSKLPEVTALAVQIKAGNVMGISMGSEGAGYAADGNLMGRSELCYCYLDLNPKAYGLYRSEWFLSLQYPACWATAVQSTAFAQEAWA